MDNVRPWIFRVLILIIAGFLIFTFIQPWWTAYIETLEINAVEVYPYGMVSNIPVEYEYLVVGYDQVMPGWFTPFMWAYMGLCVLALIFSLFVSSSKKVGFGKLKISLPNALIGIVGISYIVVIGAALLTISMNAANFFDTQLIGRVFVSMGGTHSSYVTTDLQTGFWLACIAGPLLIILALLRNKIIGNK